MATFDWATCTIDMSNARGGVANASLADLQALPSDEQATVSCAHEYVHFLQSMGSYSAFAMVAEFLEIATAGALLLQGVLKDAGNIVSGYHPVLRHLKSTATHAGASLIINARLQSLLDEACALLLPQSVKYGGAKQAWEQEVAVVKYGTYSNGLDGFVTPTGYFRPFNIAFLAENMARQIDRWVAGNESFSHTWPKSNEEHELYNGLREILSQPRYQHNATPATIERISVVICSLGLASHSPDRATTTMLNRLEDRRTCGGLPQTVALVLKDTLVAEGLLHADAFNEIIDKLQHGPTRTMDRVEYLGIYEMLKKLRVVVNTVLGSPDYFARQDTNWSTITEWMSRFGVPPIQASDGRVSTLAGITPSDDISTLLAETIRVFT